MAKATLKNAKEIALAVCPGLIAERYRATRLSPVTWWIHESGNSKTLGEGATERHAWKDAAERLRTTPDPEVTHG